MTYIRASPCVQIATPDDTTSFNRKPTGSAGKLPGRIVSANIQLWKGVRRTGGHGGPPLLKFDRTSAKRRHHCRGGPLCVAARASNSALYRQVHGMMGWLAERGTRDYNYDQQRQITYANDAIVTVIFKKGGSSYVFRNRRFRSFTSID